MIKMMRLRGATEVQRAWPVTSVGILLTICLFAMTAGGETSGRQPGPATVSMSVQPVAFEQNVGQSGEYRFIARQNGFALGFLDQGLEVSLASQPDQTGKLRLVFDGARRGARPDGERMLPGKVNYLRGKDPSRWTTGIPLFAAVRYVDIYPGIDLLFYGNEQHLEHDFRLSPEANPGTIKMRIEGAKHLEISDSGDLIVRMPQGELKLRRPIAYQETSTGRVEVAAAFRLEHESVGFVLGPYDRSVPLIIDPILDYSTYLSSGYVQAAAVASDAEGNTYIAGITFDPSYPATSGAFQSSCMACSQHPDVFVTKLKADGSGQIYSTFLGGSDYDQAYGLAVDASGNAVVVGKTSSKDFPLKNSIDTTEAGYAVQYAFVTSLSPDGSALNYSTVLGAPADPSSSADSMAVAVRVDGDGNAYVLGNTDSPAFPTTPGAIKTLTPNYPDWPIFLVKFSPAGVLGYSAILGKASWNCRLAVDGSGNAYVFGQSEADWPTTAGAYQPTVPATQSGAPAVSKVSADGSQFIYSTFLANGSPADIAVDSIGGVIVTGSSAGPDFPLTPDARVGTLPTGVYPSWITKLNASGTGLVYSSYLTDSSATSTAVALDHTGNIWIAGSTGGPAEIPLVHPILGLPPFDLFFNDTAFVMRFDPSGKELLFSSYFGAPNSGTHIAAITTDQQDKAHIVGTTTGGLYTTSGAFMPEIPLPADSTPYGFAAKIDAGTPAPAVCISSPYDLGVDFSPILVETAASISLTITNCGSLPLNITGFDISDTVFSVPAASNNCQAEIAADASCSFEVQFRPVAAISTESMLHILSNAAIPSLALRLTGQGAIPRIDAQGIAPFENRLLGTTGSGYVLVRSVGLVPLHLDLAQTSITGDFTYRQQGCDRPLLMSGCVFFVDFTPRAAGKRTGTLQISSDDPDRPVVSIALSGTGYATFPVPVISFVEYPALPAAPESAPIIIHGQGFFPESVVRVNGQAQPTTSEWNDTIFASIDAAMRSTVGEARITVANPAPGGGESAATIATVYRRVAVEPSALVSVPSRNRLYVAIPDTAAENPNTVVAVDPSTGAIETPLAVGRDPRHLTASDDGKFLYVALRGDKAIQRINLTTNSIDRTYSFPPGGSFTLFDVGDMRVVPGNPTSLVAFIGEWSGNMGTLALYSDNGLVNALSEVEIGSFAFLDPSTVYALPFSQGANQYFQVFTIGSSGLSRQSVSGPGAGPYETGAQVVSDGTLLYTSAGEVWDPASRSLIGTFPVKAYNPTSYPNFFNLTSDPSSQQLFLLADQSYGLGSAIVLTAYDTPSLQAVGTVAFAFQSAYPNDLCRWGTDGFAFIGESLESILKTQLYVFRSSIATRASGASAAVSPAFLQFDTQFQGTPSTTQTVVLTNNGTQVLNIRGMTITAPFTMTHDCGPRLNPGSFCSISVIYSPHTAGSHSGTLTINDGAVGSPHVVALTGYASGALFIAPAEGTSTQVTLSNGEIGAYTLTASAAAGFQGTVILSCAGAPANATCSVSPATVTLSPGQSSNFSVTVRAGKSSAAGTPPSGFLRRSMSLWAVLFVPLLGIGYRRVQSRVRVLLLVVICLLLLGWVSCGGGGNDSVFTPPPVNPPENPTTPTGTYTLTVTGTSGSVVSTQDLTLVIR